MKTSLNFLLAVLFLLPAGINAQTAGSTIVDPAVINTSADSVLKIEMSYSSFGVESDDAPNIEVKIDFTKGTNSCVISYYNPAIKGSTYTLTKNEMASIQKLLSISSLEKLKARYEDEKTDQPSSLAKIYTTKKTYVIYDYALQGADPLQQLYKIVYRQ